MALQVPKGSGRDMLAAGNESLDLYLAHHRSLGSEPSSLDTLVCSFAAEADKELVAMYCLSSFGQSRCLANKIHTQESLKQEKSVWSDVV